MLLTVREELGCLAYILSLSSLPTDHSGWTQQEARELSGLLASQLHIGFRSNKGDQKAGQPKKTPGRMAGDEEKI